MTKKSFTTCLTWIFSLLIAGAAFAQDQPPPPSFNAIDTYLCNYKDGKNRSDLDKVIAKWNKWMDGSGGPPYSAWVLTPALTSVNMPIDVAWLGAWDNGTDMGKGMQTWMEQGGELQTEYDKVLDCAEHSNAASVNIRPPQEDWPGAGGVAVFSNCTLAEGKTPTDAMAAHGAWAEQVAASGSKAGMWAFFPGPGNNNPEWNHKLVVSHPDFESFGAFWEFYTNGQGYVKAMEIYGGVVSCDTPRVYQSTTVRDGGISPTS